MISRAGEQALDPIHGAPEIATEVVTDRSEMLAQPSKRFRDLTRRRGVTDAARDRREHRQNGREVKRRDLAPEDDLRELRVVQRRFLLEERLGQPSKQPEVVGDRIPQLPRVLLHPDLERVKAEPNRKRLFDGRCLEQKGRTVDFLDSFDVVNGRGVADPTAEAEERVAERIAWHGELFPSKDPHRLTR
jgi:hypothetical protein